uniref:Uncharacterized protein n=1 Tax=Ditylenchus dipsaci TaxID=166011 RepID=A0A915CLB5_9BILA
MLTTKKQSCQSDNKVYVELRTALSVKRRNAVMSRSQKAANKKEQRVKASMITSLKNKFSAEERKRPGRSHKQNNQTAAEDRETLLSRLVQPKTRKTVRVFNIYMHTCPFPRKRSSNTFSSPFAFRSTCFTSFPFLSQIDLLFDDLFGADASLPPMPTQWLDTVSTESARAPRRALPLNWKRRSYQCAMLFAMCLASSTLNWPKNLQKSWRTMDTYMPTDLCPATDSKHPFGVYCCQL